MCKNGLDVQYTTACISHVGEQLDPLLGIAAVAREPHLLRHVYIICNDQDLIIQDGDVWGFVSIIIVLMMKENPLLKPTISVHFPLAIYMESIKKGGRNNEQKSSINTYL